MGTDLLAFRPMRARRMLLVEQPGAWGSADPRDSGLSAPVVDELLSWARDEGWELRLIRRGPRRYRVARRTCLLVHAERGASVMSRHMLDDPRRILDLAATGPLPVTGAPEGPLYAVEARHGRDIRRSRRSHPVAAALRDLRPDATWEISRAGDEDGPATLVILPDAVLYDHMGPAAVPAVVAAHERGDLALEWARGRAGDPWEVRVAEHLVRRSTGRAAMADLAQVGIARHGDDEATVAFDAEGAGVLEVRVRRSLADEVGRPVCSGACGASVRYELVSMRVATPAAGTAPAPRRPAASIA